MIINKSVVGLVIGASYESVKFAFENSYDLVYSEIDYPDLFKHLDLVEYIDEKMMMLSLSGNLHYIKKSSMLVDFDSSFVTLKSFGNALKLFYDKIYFYDDCSLTRKIEKKYKEGWRRSTIYSFEIQGGINKSGDAGFDFDLFGFDSLDVHNKIKGVRTSHAHRRFLLEHEKYNIVDEKNHYGFRVIEKNSNYEYVFFNKHWRKLKEWEKSRLSKLGSAAFTSGPATELRDAKWIFNRICFSYDGPNTNFSPSDCVSDVLDSLINVLRKKKNILLYEEEVRHRRKCRISDYIIEESSKHSNIEVCNVQGKF